MKIEAAQKKILEYLQKRGPVNTFRLSRYLKTDRIELIKIIEELTGEGLATFKSDVVARVNKDWQEKEGERLGTLGMNLLSDVHPHKEFCFCNGVHVKNLQELLTTLETINDAIYQFHANNEKNDFSRWINEVIGDSELASKLKIADKQKAITILKDRIEQLTVLE